MRGNNVHVRYILVKLGFVFSLRICFSFWSQEPSPHLYREEWFALWPHNIQLDESTVLCLHVDFHFFGNRCCLAETAFGIVTLAVTGALARTVHTD
jgi:hypothetical protein